MKNNLLIIALATIFFACKKEKAAVALNEPFSNSQSTLLSQGTFTSNAHPTSGNVKLYSQGNTKTLVFENFHSDNGPDLRVYLSKATNNADFRELGTLKSTLGDFNYDVDTTINTSDYKFVLIWCEDFSVLFGSATLQ